MATIELRVCPMRESLAIPKKNCESGVQILIQSNCFFRNRTTVLLPFKLKCWFSFLEESAFGGLPLIMLLQGVLQIESVGFAEFEICIPTYNFEPCGGEVYASVLWIWSADTFGFFPFRQLGKCRQVFVQLFSHCNGGEYGIAAACAHCATSRIYKNRHRVEFYLTAAAHLNG